MKIISKMARKIVKKLSKEQKSLLIGLLIGEDCKNFIKIIKPYILQVPSLLYKIRKDFTKEQFIALQNEDSEARDISEYIF